MCFLELTILKDVFDGDVRINPTMLGATHILGLQCGTLSLSRVQETYRHEALPARQIAPSEIGLSALTLESVKRRWWTVPIHQAADQVDGVAQEFLR